MAKKSFLWNFNGQTWVMWSLLAAKKKKVSEDEFLCVFCFVCMFVFNWVCCRLEKKTRSLTVKRRGGQLVIFPKPCHKRVNWSIMSPTECSEYERTLNKCLFFHSEIPLFSLWDIQSWTLLFRSRSFGSHPKILWPHSVESQYLGCLTHDSVLLSIQQYVQACMLSHFSRVWLFMTPWTVACQAPLSMGFSGQEYWSEWVAMTSFRGSSWPRDWTWVSYVSCIGKQVL